MNLAIWKQAFREAWWLMAGCVLLMFVFHWLFVYLTSFVSMSSFVDFVGELPDETHGMFGMSIKEAASWKGRIALGYVDPTVVIISAVWAIARGSDTVSGPLDRGTLEIVLAQPVSRTALLVASGTVTVLGAALMAVAAWCGTICGLATVRVEEVTYIPLTFIVWSREMVLLSDLLDGNHYLHSAINLFFLTVFTAALTTLVSACGRYRRRTIGIVGGFYIVQIIFKVTGLMAAHLDWLFYLTFLGAYWPQRLAVAAGDVEHPDRVWQLAQTYNGVLLAGAVIGYLAAAVVFYRRDLPAAL